MKHLIYIILIIISAFCGYFYATYDMYEDINSKPHFYNVREILAGERRLSNALLEGLHWYMRDDSVRWYNTFMNTVEYKNIEKANNGDWEDFYAEDWK